MSLNLDEKLKKDNTFEEINTKNIKETFSLKKSISYISELIIEGFSKITGITIKSSLVIISSLVLKISSKMNILSNQSIKSILTFTSKKKIEMDCLIGYDSSMNIDADMNMVINNYLEFTSRKSATLDYLDSFILDDLDIQTLSELGFSKGVKMIITKRIESDSNIEFNSAISLILYHYNRLEDFDNLLLSEMDSSDFSYLDKTIIL